jgi:hypothetical protein
VYRLSRAGGTNRFYRRPKLDRCRPLLELPLYFILFVPMLLLIIVDPPKPSIVIIRIHREDIESESLPVAFFDRAAPESAAACGKSPARRCAAALGRIRGPGAPGKWYSLKYERVSTTKKPAQRRKQDEQVEKDSENLQGHCLEF